MLFTKPPVELTRDMWMLGTAEYPLFLCKADHEATIFEGGVGAMGPVLLRQLRELGVSHKMVNQIVITHAHPDHVMAVPFLDQQFPDADIIGSHISAKTLAAEKAVSFFTKIDGALTDSLLAADIITEEDRPEPLLVPHIAVDRTVEEGDTIAVGDAFSFEVIETPGHSDCSLSFHDAARKILIISDATGYYMPEHDFLWPNYFVDYGNYMASIERLAALPARVLCLSHNTAMKGEDNIKAYFANALARTKAYHERIVAAATAGKSPKEIAALLGEEVYQNTQLLPLDFFQKNCALLVKQSLEHAGFGVDL
jgi:glyoxylase-like metal-dependent hydrolase (beta-lactamase superfamily II)